MRKAGDPQKLHALWLHYADAGNAEGVTALYEPDALVIAPDGQELRGAEAIYRFYKAFLASGVSFNDVRQRASIVHGDLAITSMRLPEGVTCELARRQADGSWLWVIDKPMFSADHD